MALSDKDINLMAVGGAFLLLLLFIAYHETDNKGQARYQPSGQANPALSYLDSEGHWFDPELCVPGQQQIYTAHRYPTHPGHEITVLINQGLDAMSRRAPQDEDWRTMPPSEMSY